MRYAHRYAYLPSDPGYAQAWPQILTDTATIIEQVRRAGIVIAGPDGYRRPTLSPTEGIELNGDATSDLDGAAFQLPAAAARPSRGNTDGHRVLHHRPQALRPCGSRRTPALYPGGSRRVRHPRTMTRPGDNTCPESTSTISEKGSTGSSGRCSGRKRKSKRHSAGTPTPRSGSGAALSCCARRWS